MSLQVVVKATSVKNIESALGSIATQCEIFPIKIGHFGLSIPTKVIESLNEKDFESRLAAIEHFDLWAGTWKKPKPKWKLW